MSRTKLFLSASFLFLCGALFGAVVFHLVMRFRLMPPFHGRPPSPMEAMMNHLDRELSLSEVQREQIFPIVREMHEKLESFRLESRPKMEALLDEAVEKGKEVLAPGQQEKLLRLREQAREHLSRVPGELPGPPPMGPPPLRGLAEPPEESDLGGNLMPEPR